MKTMSQKEIKAITTSDANTKGINEFGALKESFFKESLQEEE